MIVRALCIFLKSFFCLFVYLNSSVKRETLKLVETFLDKAEDQPQIGKQFVPPMMDPVLGDYARNLPDARESEVLSLFATIINKFVIRFCSCYFCYIFLPCFSRILIISCACKWQLASKLRWMLPKVTFYPFLYCNLTLLFLINRYKGAMVDDVPRIFEAVFQCTLEVRFGICFCYGINNILIYINKYWLKFGSIISNNLMLTNIGFKSYSGVKWVLMSPLP